MSDTGADGDGAQDSERAKPGLGGFRVVFSGGSISGRWPEWEELIERHGGIVSEDISEETDYLIVNADADEGEREAAANHDVPIIMEGEFRDLLEAKGVTQ